MQNLARKVNREMPSLDEGRVVRVGGGTITVRVADFECEARRAKSCLVDPEVGDDVLISFGAGGRCHVLAVLEGAEADGQAKTKVTVDGDLEFVAPSGNFGVRAGKNASLAAGSEVGIVGRALSVSALEGSVVVQTLTYVGHRLRAEVEGIKTFALAWDSIVERVSQRVKRSYRTVEELEQVKAKMMDYASESTMTFRAENAVVQAEQVAKIDAASIQLG